MHADGLVALHVLDAVRVSPVLPNNLSMSLLRRRLRAGGVAQERVARGRAERDCGRDGPEPERTQVFLPAREQGSRNNG
jgi:hypothetical protein